MARCNRKRGRLSRVAAGRMALWAAFGLWAWQQGRGVAVAGEEAAPPPVRLRRLRGLDRRAAREARDRADGLRAAYQMTYGGRHPKVEGKAAAFAKAKAAYEAVMEKYPQTKIAAYCQLRLIGLYQFARDYDAAKAQANDMAKRYAGTEHEAEAYFTMGLMYLQALHDPAGALPWLEKVPVPAEPGEGSLHYSAALQTIKCEVRLGQPAEAARRCKELTEIYPQFSNQIASHFRFELRSALSARSLAPIHPALKAWMQANPQAANPQN